MNLTFVTAILKQNTQIHLSAYFTSLSWADLQLFSQAQFIIKMHSCAAVVLYSTATHAVSLFLVHSLSHHCSHLHSFHGMPHPGWSRHAVWPQAPCTSLRKRTQKHCCTWTQAAKGNPMLSWRDSWKVFGWGRLKKPVLHSADLRQNTWSKLNFSHEKIWFHGRQFLGKRNCAVVAFQLDMMCFILSFAPFLTSLRLYYILGVTFQMAVCFWNKV